MNDVDTAACPGVVLLNLRCISGIKNMVLSPSRDLGAHVSPIQVSRILEESNTRASLRPSSRSTSAHRWHRWHRWHSSISRCGIRAKAVRTLAMRMQEVAVRRELHQSFLHKCFLLRGALCMEEITVVLYDEELSRTQRCHGHGVHSVNGDGVKRQGHL